MKSKRLIIILGTVVLLGATAAAAVFYLRRSPKDAGPTDGGSVRPPDETITPTAPPQTVPPSTPPSSTPTYRGAVIAGTLAASPLLDFTQTDFEQARAGGKLVVLYFYANWCPICREETANALYPFFNALTGDDVVGFRVNFNDNQTDANERALAREFGIAYQHSKVFLRNGVRTLKSPESWDRARYEREVQAARTNR